MKIRDFIELLKEYNPDADITLTNSEDICLSYICEDIENGGKLTKEDTFLVFIEPKDVCPLCSSEYMNGDIMWCSFYDCACRDVEECYQFEEFDEI